MDESAVAFTPSWTVFIYFAETNCNGAAIRLPLHTHSHHCMLCRERNPPHDAPVINTNILLILIKI